jgi:hypothetical protein
MGVAVVAAAAAVAVVHRPPLFACGCYLPLPTVALLSSPLTLGMYFPSLHIFNVGIPNTQTDTTDRRQFNHFCYEYPIVCTYVR